MVGIQCSFPIGANGLFSGGFKNAVSFRGYVTSIFHGPRWLRKSPFLKDKPILNPHSSTLKIKGWKMKILFGGAKKANFQGAKTLLVFRAVYIKTSFDSLDGSFSL